MLNLKNNDNDAVFDEICKKSHWLKSNQPPLNSNYFEQNKYFFVIWNMFDIAIL